MTEFKVGDKVYYPALGEKVYTLLENDDDVDYPLYVKRGGQLYSLTIKGFFRRIDKVPSILHATDANHALLEELYGVQFEKPPVKPEPMEIIAALLEHNKYVPCCVSNGRNEEELAKIFARGETIATDSVHTVDNGDYHPYAAIGGTRWRYAVPIDLKTGEVITQIPTGDKYGTETT